MNIQHRPTALIVFIFAWLALAMLPLRSGANIPTLASKPIEQGLSEQALIVADAATPAGKAPGAPVSPPVGAPARVTASQEITPGMATRAAAILLFFIVIAISIAMRKMPAMIALPILAAGIGLIAGIPITGPDGILATILEGRTSPNPQGAFFLYKSIIYVLLGGMFAKFISDAGIAEQVVKFTAEYGGENPFIIALLMSAVTALIFTAIGGLPVIIMLGTVMFPVLLSLGVPATVCGGMLMLSFPIGAALSPAGWGSTAALYNVSFETVRRFYIIWALVQTIFLLIFLSIEFLRMKRTSVTPASVLRSIGAILGCAVLLFVLLYGDKVVGLVSPGAKQVVAPWGKGREFALFGFRWIVGLALLAAIAVSQARYWTGKRAVGSWNMITPILPLVFLLGFGFKDAIVPAFLVSLAYGFFTTPRERGMQKLGKSIIDGMADVAAPTVLLIGIGMLISAAMHPNVDHVLTPILARVIPTRPLPYILFFLLASPLSLYRGPLNTFGLGAGLARLMMNVMRGPLGAEAAGAATMGALQSVSMLQDPTTTQNIWVCGYLKLNINALLFKLFIYSIGLCIAGLVLTTVLFFR